MEAIFLEKIRRDRQCINFNSASFSKEKYQETIAKLKIAKIRQKRESADYKLFKKYEILTVDGAEKLIVPLKGGWNIVYYVHDEELFGILNNVHLQTNHGGRDKMMKELKKSYKNITYKDVNFFLSLCEQCLQKQKKERKEDELKPNALDELYSRGQVDLIYYQSHSDGEFKYIMIYQHLKTKFTVLKPLKSQDVDEVASNLVDIFTTLGAPAILHSNNGGEFVSQVITEINKIWPDIKVLRGRSGTVNIDHPHQDIEDMIKEWMKTSGSTSWSKQLKFFQLQKNSNTTRKVSPFEALCGHPMKLGVNPNCLPKEILDNLISEEDLEKIIYTPREENEEREVEDPLDEITIKEEAEEMISCGVCQTECHDDFQCNSCGNYMHKICGNDNEGAENLCLICDRKRKIEEQNENASKRRKTENPEITRGTNVCILVNEQNHKNSCLAVVLEVESKGFYKLGNKNGVLADRFLRSQFQVCLEKIIKVEDVPSAEQAI